MRHQRNVEGLRDNAQKKRQAAMERTEEAIRQLIKAGKQVNFQAVAKAGGVSTAWLYKEPDIKVRIEHLREQSQPKQTQPSVQRVSDASKDAINRTLKERIKKLEAENRGLRDQLEVAYGLTSPELVETIEVLQHENQELQKQLELSNRRLKEARAEVEMLKNQRHLNP